MVRKLQASSRSGLSELNIREAPLASRHNSEFPYCQLNVVRRCLFWTFCLLAIGHPFCLWTEESFRSVYLSEILVQNTSGLKDEQGERAGWVELYNASQSPVKLNGWFLTDNPTNLTKWRFPGVVLLPDKHLIVFASGKARTNDLAHLHANFRFDAGSRYVALAGPSTNLVSSFTLGETRPDVSYGRVRGEPSVHGPLLQPTPGRHNSTSGPGFSSGVAFSTNSHTFLEPFSLRLSTPSTNAIIHYTVDGNLPTNGSPIYQQPLLITNTAQVRARAYQPQKFPGPVHTEAYLKLDSNVVAFSSSLPVLVMETFGRNVPVSAQGSLVHLSLFEPSQGKASLTNRPTLVTRGSFHVRGSTSSGFSQSPFALKFLDEFDDERNLSPLGLPADTDWVLYAPNRYDLAMIHNPFVYQLSRDIGRYSPRTRFIEAYLVRSPGTVKSLHYQGLYVLTERIKVSKHRVNIDRLGPEDLKAPNVTGGYLLKFDRLGPGERGVFSYGDRGMIYVEPREQTIRLPQRSSQEKYLEAFLNEFGAALNGPKWKDPVLGYRAYLDVDAAIDFHVLEVLSGNVDAMVLSTYFYKPRGGKITCGPHWDFDRALGSTDGRDDNPRNWNTGPYFSGNWWPQLLSDPDFWQQWVDRWQLLRQSHFALTNLNRLIDQLYGEVREAQPREYRRWDLEPRGGTYEAEIGVMRSWLSNRVEFIDSELVSLPRFMPPSGAVKSPSTLTLSAATNATIYYTWDGSDPRLPQGAVSSSANVYKAPLTLNSNSTLIVRAFDSKQRQSGGPPISTPWSGAVTGKFAILRP
jgi:hypothetical protein